MREREWLQANFIKVTKTASGSSVFKSELLPDKVFFSKEKLKEYVDGKRYKRLIHEMRKGMRTYADNKKLQRKAEARRERKQDQHQQKAREKRKRQRNATSDDSAEIERRKAAFAAKKARRLERKAAAAAE